VRPGYRLHGTNINTGRGSSCATRIIESYFQSLKQEVQDVQHGDITNLGLVGRSFSGSIQAKDVLTLIEFRFRLRNALRK
jgi:hypothetical protein